MILLDEVPGLVAARLQLPAGGSRRPRRIDAGAGHTDRQRRELYALTQQAWPPGSGGTGQVAATAEPADISGGLARVRASAAANEALRTDGPEAGGMLRRARHP